MKETLDAYRDQFKEVVLKHLNRMPQDEWQRLRSFAANATRHVGRGVVANLSASPVDLIDSALSEDGISVDEMLIPDFKNKSVSIGHIEGKPVFYITGQGIYLWGIEPTRGLSLSLWVTYPAYPPAW